MTLTKAHLKQILMEIDIHLSPYDAKTIINLFFEEILIQLEQGSEVKLAGLGKFEPRFKKARPGRNPKTGESHKIASRRIVAFSPSVKLKNQINENLRTKAIVLNNKKASKTNK